MLLQAPARMMFSCGRALLERGWPRHAAASLTLAAHCASTDARCWVEAARAYRQLGDRDTAARYCERALELDPSYKPANQLLRSLFFHGDGYHTVLAALHEQLRPRTYIEIGVALGDALRHIGPGTLAIGIDPEPRVSYTPPANVQLFAETSDGFFDRRDVRDHLQGWPLDLAFIDGLHHFDAVLRDFMNVEALCHAGSVVLLHDSVPWTRQTSARERTTLLWTGDVWRAIVLLKKYRPDLSIHTIATPPSGLTVVTNLDPSSTVLGDRLSLLIDEGSALDFSYLASDRAGKLNLVDNDGETLRRVIDGRATAAHSR